MVRDTLTVSDSVLSKHLKVLQAASHVCVTKVRGDSHRRTWLALTPEGQRALAGHIAELQRIVEMAQADE
ncbi:transcriptional regulator [Streptomyces kronopolitis]